MTTALPGLVDLQVNGFRGLDFSSRDLTEESCARACRQLAARGLTAFCPTLITSPLDLYRRNLPIIAALARQPEFADLILGIHLEGPFISPDPAAAGAHNPAWTRTPDPALLDDLQDWAHGAIRIITIAAELPAAPELARHATDLGISVFLGHQLASVDHLRTLAHAGARCLTHLGNAIPQYVHRFNNPLLHGLAVDELAATIITDGHHLPPHLIQTIIRCKGIQNVAVVSDAAPIAGLPPGDYTTLGNPARLEPSGRLINPQTNLNVGSSAILPDCLNFLRSLNLFTPQDLAQLFHHNPLKLVTPPTP